ncbi:MAG: NAD(+) synthase [Crocinitomicaceae bacterium]|nr:NAD(+) synthase [Crocinitomicaceae bacterium]
MNYNRIQNYIVNWLKEYCESASQNGFVVGVSGGVDSAVTSTLCALTGLPTLVLNMPILQQSNQFYRSKDHISWLGNNFENIKCNEVDLTNTFNSFEDILPDNIQDHLTMANLRSRMRMTTLYAFASHNKFLVAGTGNKVEDFGVGFYTKYGDGGVDLSPIADLMKSEVFGLASHMGIISSILNAAPTDGLWDDDRSDEDQIGATYDELEWAMEFSGSAEKLNKRQLEVIKIYNKMHLANLHKMNSIPVCKIPIDLK